MRHKHVMIRATDIHSLTEFTRNAKAYIGQIKGNKMPMAITVNGVAQVVVQDAESYQSMVDELERFRVSVTLSSGLNTSNSNGSNISQSFSMVRGSTSE